MNTERVFEKESKYERVYRSLHDLYMISVIREGYEYSIQSRFVRIVLEAERRNDKIRKEVQAVKRGTSVYSFYTNTHDEFKERRTADFILSLPLFVANDIVEELADMMVKDEDDFLMFYTPLDEKEEEKEMRLLSRSSRTWTIKEIEGYDMEKEDRFINVYITNIG